MILVTSQGECLISDMEIIIRADENSVKDALETGGGELNVSVSTGSIEKCSSEGEAEDLLDAEGQAQCHEALKAIIYLGKRKLHFEILLHLAVLRWLTI